MIDPSKANDPAEGASHPMESHSDGPDQRTADLHHNEDTAVRSSGDQPPGETPAKDRDRQKTPGINPGY